MKKINDFLKKYKKHFILSLCAIFALVSGFFSQLESIKRENAKDDGSYAFEADGLEVSTDKVFKDGRIETMPDERVSKNDVVLPEAFPESDNKEPLVKKEELDSLRALEVSKAEVFSLKAPLSGDISKAYSVAPIYSETMDDWRNHEAIDIVSSLGKEVVCAYDGVVTQVGKDSLLGFYIKIRHNDTMETLYANLHSEVTVIEGQEIEKGHVIGYVGESSMSESKDLPHLHFEVIKEGKRVNPKDYIK